MVDDNEDDDDEVDHNDDNDCGFYGLLWLELFDEI